MPPRNIVSDYSGAQYPHIKAFIESEQADLSLLGPHLPVNDQRYHLNLVDNSSPFLSILQLCSRYGKTEHLKLLPWTPLEKRAAVKAHHYFAIQCAAQNNHIDTIKQLETYLTNAEKKEAAKYAISAAARNGHIETIQYLETHLTDNEKKEAVKANGYYTAILEASQSGRTDVIQYLENHLTKDEKKAAVTTDLIREASRRGYTDTIKHLMTHLTDDEKKAAAMSWNYDAILNAARNSHIDTIKQLTTHLTDDEIKTAVKAQNYFVLQCALSNDCADLIEYLEPYVTAADKKEAVITRDYYLIRSAARNGRINIIRRLEAHLTDAEKKAAVKAENYDAILSAASNGHTDMLEHLEMHLTTTEKRAAVKANAYNMISYTAQNGHIETLKHLEKHLKAGEKQAAVMVENSITFAMAARKGQTDIIKYLEKHLTNAGKKAALKAGIYSVIRAAALGRHTDTLNYLESQLTNNDKRAAVMAEDYHALRCAATNGYTDLIKHLETYLTDEEKKAAVMAINYATIQEAARHGYINTIKHLETHLTNDEKRVAVKTDNYAAIKYAAHKGHTDILMHLEAHLTNDDKKEMLMCRDSNLIELAASNGHTDTIKRWESYLTDDEKKAALQADDYHVIRNAINSDNTVTLQHFLNCDAVLAYMEAHDQEYGQRYVYDFVAQKLEELQNRKQAYEQANPGGVFNIEAEEARLGFYMLRNFIRRGVDREYASAERNEEHLRFLLSIPAIKNLAHVAVTPGRANELLRLADNLGNEQAARLLLEIPAVHELVARALADRNHFYSHANAGVLDLRALARDRESSMNALSQDEQRRLAKATRHYDPLLRNLGVARIMDGLRNQLIQYYLDAPALLNKDNGRTIKLPVTWEEFQALRLSPGEKERALRAYYQNSNHSALRYLSKPNRWIHEQADYIHKNERNPQYKWAAFEEFQPLIAMCWLAAKDEKYPPPEGHTLAGRIEHFIRELALLGRAHNWDKTRIQNDRRQEYDDLEADRPSCYSGVKRRLFQSVLGHPLLKILTSDDLKQEVRDFALDYFKKEIARLNNKDAMLEAFNNYLSILDEESANPLACLNITDQEQTNFLLRLTNKYGEDFANNPDFMRLVQSLITLNPESKEVSDHYHALKLDGLTRWRSCLGQVEAHSDNQPNEQPSQTRFFIGENLEILLWTPPPEFANLCIHLNQMYWHGQDLWPRDNGEKKGSAIMELALALKTDIKNFSEQPMAQQISQKETFKKDFIAKLHSKDGIMSQHREHWKVIIAHVLLAFTGIGLFAIGIQYLRTGHGFFEQTQCNKLIEKVEQAEWMPLAHN